MKKSNIKLHKKEKRQRPEIPIIFSTDDNYVPFLEITIRSIIDNASKKYNYVINVLNTGLSKERTDKVKLLENDNFKINFCDISGYVGPMKDKLKNIYHFSLATWYRLFIQSIFPQYDKVLYLDCDIIVLGDISELYNTKLGDNLLGAARCHIVSDHEVFGEYAERFCGVPRRDYLQAGILVMNLAEFRKRDLENKFVYLINKYNFDVIDPDQGYLNAMCYGSVKQLPNGWNKEAIPAPLEGKLNIVHYALYKKPWQYDDVMNKEYFWHYAKQSPFYDEIVAGKENFSDEQKAKKEEANLAIVEHARRVMDSAGSFVNQVIKGDPNWFNNLKIEA
ncbi:MAG: glycosyltransferase family 8 protein [Clostridiales bacterium]|nr:glycosyltransferase family 8 protein [Clostridiales bacterium]